jgi:hypothetical protein
MVAVFVPVHPEDESFPVLCTPTPFGACRMGRFRPGGGHSAPDYRCESCGTGVSQDEFETNIDAGDELGLDDDGLLIVVRRATV